MPLELALPVARYDWERFLVLIYWQSHSTTMKSLSEIGLTYSLRLISSVSYWLFSRTRGDIKVKFNIIRIMTY